MSSQRWMRVIAAIALLGGGLLATGEEETIFNEEIKLLSFSALDYPLGARLARVQGVVVVRVTLDDGGRVVDSIAISGPEKLIADCVANSRKWRFQPHAAKAAVIVYQVKFEGLCLSGCPSRTTFWPPNFVTVITGDPVAQQ